MKILARLLTISLFITFLINIYAFAMYDDMKSGIWVLILLVMYLDLTKK
jgi:hypothetical protein